MARALRAGQPVRSRPFFGLFDPDGWAWATTKAVFWLLVIILALGYIPDRAYYFVVSRTIDLGIIAWSPINLCPPENTTSMPCPAPAGAILPWQASPNELALPEGREGGAAAQVGTNLLYIGGSNGTAATDTTFVATLDKGTYGPWSTGPALPAARTKAAVANLSGTVYLIAGEGPDGKPTDTVWSLGLDPDSAALKTWTPVAGAAKDKNLTLPEPRSGASGIAVTDGIVVAGGRGVDGKPSNKVWKATVDASSGKLGEFKEQAPLQHAVADAASAFEGTFVWVYGGSDDKGPIKTVQRGTIGGSPANPGASGAPGGSAAPASAAASPAASGVASTAVSQWATSQSADLPAPRTGAAGFAANGAMYLVGGSDGTAAKRELYWTLPDASGNLPAGGWSHLDATDLPMGILDGAPVVTGANVLLIGGKSDGAPLRGAYRASLAPQLPFFRAGLLGVTVPGLQIGGEIGQQLGYLAAAGVGTGNFVILVIVAWMFNHRPQIRAWMDRRRAAREARAPAER
jgi:N-acetylneuraminic acid mutarotase